jgi:protein-S-isoprenylcysteine O-methyltransferase Ste14
LGGLILGTANNCATRFGAVMSYQITLATLLGACLVSFGWGMRSFFVQPSGYTPGMRVIAACGYTFAALHLGAILLARHVPLERFCLAGSLYAAGLALYWWAIATNRKRRLSAVFSDDLPTHLVQDGPYRLVRHPFYCSYLMVWLAGVIGSGRLWLLATVAVMLGIYLRAAYVEERKFARGALANEYEAFRSRTGLLIPNPWKMVTTRPRKVMAARRSD